VGYVHAYETTWDQGLHSPPPNKGPPWTTGGTLFWALGGGLLFGPLFGGSGGGLLLGHGTNKRGGLLLEREKIVSATI